MCLYFPTIVQQTGLSSIWCILFCSLQTHRLMSSYLFKNWSSTDGPLTFVECFISFQTPSLSWCAYISNSCSTVGIHIYLVHFFHLTSNTVALCAVHSLNDSSSLPPPALIAFGLSSYAESEHPTPKRLDFNRSWHTHALTLSTTG